MKEQQYSPLKRYHNIKQKTCWQKLINRKINYTELLDRSILSNLPDDELPVNKIETSKYNYFTFLPLNIIEQFSKLSNIYFLFIGILQIIPQITISQGKPTIFIPLIIVVLISMIKDFIEDMKRRNNDIKQNQSQVELLSSVGFVSRKWQDLKVGDVIKVKKNQYFPCDIILLSHSQQAKTAFIQTKNLDGETNLKLKSVPEHLTFIHSISDLDLSSLKIEFSFEKPNPFFTSFNGYVKIQQQKYIIDNSHVVLRGCSLKINQKAIGLCVYTGTQTKIMLNSGIKNTKVSKLEQYLNKYFLYIFVLQFVVTLISAIIFGILLQINLQQLGQTKQGVKIIGRIFFTWGSWFISFSNFIPISLLVTVQIVRYGQGILLNKDQLCKSKGMYTEVQTTSQRPNIWMRPGPMMVNNPLSLNPSMKQIKMIFHFSTQNIPTILHPKSTMVTVINVNLNPFLSPIYPHNGAPIIAATVVITEQQARQWSSFTIGMQISFMYITMQIRQSGTSIEIKKRSMKRLSFSACFSDWRGFVGGGVLLLGLPRCIFFSCPVRLFYRHQAESLHLATQPLPPPTHHLFCQLNTTQQQSKSPHTPQLC